MIKYLSHLANALCFECFEREVFDTIYSMLPAAALFHQIMKEFVYGILHY